MLKGIMDSSSIWGMSPFTQAKVVTVDITTTVATVGTIAISVFIPGVGWAFAAGVLAGVGISALTELWKASWID